MISISITADLFIHISRTAQWAYHRTIANPLGASRRARIKFDSSGRRLKKGFPRSLYTRKRYQQAGIFWPGIYPWSYTGRPDWALGFAFFSFRLFDQKFISLHKSRRKHRYKFLLSVNVKLDDRRWETSAEFRCKKLYLLL